MVVSVGDMRSSVRMSGPLDNVATLVAEVGGGLLRIVGYQARIAAATLAVFTVLAAVFFHNNLPIRTR